MSKVGSIALGSWVGDTSHKMEFERERDEEISFTTSFESIPLPHDAKISYYALPLKRSTVPPATTTLRTKALLTVFKGGEAFI